MKNAVLLFAQAAGLAACGHWPPQSEALTARAGDLVAPALLPQDQVLGSPDLGAEAAGAALALQAEALRKRAAGL
jgi:hypothetical protein